MSTLKTTQVLGARLDYDDDEELWEGREPVCVPFLGNKNLRVDMFCFQAEDDGTFSERDDEKIANVLTNFLSQGSAAKEDIARKIQAYLLGILAICEGWTTHHPGQGPEEIASTKEDLKDAQNVWKYVNLNRFSVVHGDVYGYKDDEIVVLLEGESQWDEEHGISLHFAAGNVLKYVGRQG